MFLASLAEGVATSVCAAAASAAVLAEASMRPDSQIFGRSLIAGRDPLQVALTFDDGPNPVSTPPLLDLFAEHNVRGTFFMIGNFARQEPEMVRRIHAAGHVVANHTMTHPNLSWQSPARIDEELRACNRVLEDITGDRIRFFRPPHGARRPAVFRTAGQLGLTLVQWNVTGYDWNPIGAAGILNCIRQDLAITDSSCLGANILLHDGGHAHLGVDRSDTVAAVRELLQSLPAQGKRFVAVDQWA